MKLNLTGLSLSLKKIYEKIILQISYESKCDYNLHFQQADTIRVKKEKNDIYCTYIKENEIGRCILNAVLMIKEGTDGEIQEAENFATKGIMLDMSRGGVMKVSKVKEYMEYMALFGLNTLLLYMEDVYEVGKYPYFGYLRGRYSQEELKEIDRYGNSLGIEVIPCIQTLGHFEQYNKWKESEDIRDTAGVLLAEDERTYAFIDELIRTVSECFTTRKIHIGMDEAWDLGTGNYLKRKGYKNGTELFCNHIERVAEITRKYGLSPMIWSDMYFRLASQDGDYYDCEADIPVSVKQKLPDGMSIVYWDYYHTDENIYEGMIRKHHKITDRIVFAGGIWCWNGFVPDVNFTMETTKAALAACKREGIQNIIGTVWEDDGCETDHSFSLPGAMLYGEASYCDALSMERLNRISELLFHVSFTNFISLSEAAKPVEKSDLIVKQILYADPLLNMLETEMAEESIQEKYRKLADKYFALAKQEGYFDKYFEYIGAVCKLAYEKVKFSIQLKESYGDKEKMKTICLESLKNACKDLEEIHYKLWNESYKPQGFENIDSRYGGLMMRIKTAERRIREYIAGELETLEELDEKKLPFVNQNYYGVDYRAIHTPYFKH